MILTMKQYPSVNRGENGMQYNRQESFRHTFEHPIPATFRLIVDGVNEENVVFSKRGACMVIDLSPSGLRMYSKLDIPQNPWQPIHLAIDVVLADKMLTLVGEIVWKKANMEGRLYGIDLKTDEKIEYQIINELKERSRQEMKAKKPNN
jgi:hypothetical protein